VRHGVPRFSVCSLGVPPRVCSQRREAATPWLLVPLLLLLAIAGGIVVSKFLFLVLLVALLIAIVAGSRAAHGIDDLAREAISSANAER
jgi:hypothetical protein